MKSELDRHKEALAIAIDALNAAYDTGKNQIIAVHLAEIASIINPVEYEDVPVERWECAKCGRIFKNSVPMQNVDCGFDNCDGKEFFKLTGTVRREKRVPKERSVSGKVIGRTGDNLEILLFGHNPPKPSLGSDVMVTWQEEP